MGEVVVIVACTEQRVFWFLGQESPKCVEADHDHQQREVHRHRDAVPLPGGLQFLAASFYAPDPYARDFRPDFGLYLDRRWQPPWLHQHLDWPDFAVPDDATAVLAELRMVLQRARAGERVEIGCLGGHGRTGTALACLGVLAGQDPTAAIASVRSYYCHKAIETSAQEEFVVESGR